MNISSEQIRDLSVSVVEGFLNNKIPLSVGLAKQAAAAELNSEQIQRAIEATNSIAYLKVLSLSEDRTVEFPLAKYAEVMASIAVPAISQNTISDTIEKIASAEDTEIVHVFEDREKLNFLIKEAAINKAAIENLEVESISMHSELLAAAKAFGKDNAWMDKLACVSDETEFKQLSILVSGEVKEYRNLKELGLFKEAQLKQASSFTNLYKQARQLSRELTERLELQKRADDVSKAQRAMFKNPINTAVNAVGKGIGKGVGTVAAVPGKMIGAAGTGLKNSFKDTLNTMTGGAKPSLKQIGKAVTQTAGHVSGAIMGIGGAALDIAAYDPGRDSSTGRSNDVWKALQQE